MASDQWWGVRADPDHSAVASMSAVPGGLAVAALAAVPLLWLLARLHGAARATG